LAEIITGANVFSGVLALNMVTLEMAKDDSIIFAMANSVLKIMPEEIKVDGAKVVVYLAIGLCQST
jgi:malate dehydrogenase (oxaloacetate-decarboxylating)